MKKFISAAILTLICTSANAGLIFSDNFDLEAGGAGNSELNYNNFSQWSVTDGTVDVVSNTNGWGITCTGGAGKCVDLDGSSSNAGTFSSHSITLAAGEYTLSFDISGNQRNSVNDAMGVSLGGFFSEDFNRVGSVGWETIVRTFTVNSETTSSITFNHAGGDNIGIMLDNVSLVSGSANSTSIDEPAPLALLLLGVLGIAATRRKQNI